ncbi:MAG: ComF family protein [Bacteroidales bacterium]|nr:ComF family protein [Bacteroidales bacterium]
MMWLRNLVDAVYPRVCQVCGGTLVAQEQHVCLGCLMAMPRTGYHSDQSTLLWERLASPAVPIERAAAWFHYHKSTPYARLIHRAKYNSQPELCRWLGATYARELQAVNFFDGVDTLMPVPMHWWKKLRRGYNQAEEIARGISQVTGIPVSRDLKAVRRHSTQTRKGSFQRWINAQHTYVLDHPSAYAGRHILVVDDVITTGATTLANCAAIHAASSTTRISVLALTLAHK